MADLAFHANVALPEVTPKFDKRTLLPCVKVCKLRNRMIAFDAPFSLLSVRLLN